MTRFKALWAILMLIPIILALRSSSVIPQTQWLGFCGDGCPNRCDTDQPWSYAPYPPQCDWELGYYDYAGWCDGREGVKHCPSPREADDMQENAAIIRYKRTEAARTPTVAGTDAPSTSTPEPATSTPTPATATMTTFPTQSPTVDPFSADDIATVFAEGTAMRVSAELTRLAPTPTPSPTRTLEPYEAVLATIDHASTLTALPEQTALAPTRHAEITQTARAWLSTPGNPATVWGRLGPRPTATATATHPTPEQTEEA